MALLLPFPFCAGVMPSPLPFLFSSCSSPAPPNPGTLSTVKAVVARATSLYPDVPPLATVELARLLSPPSSPSAASTRLRLILVDVRSPAERAVSTLPTALSPAQFHALPAADLAGATVVPFCTVGVRSGAWGRRLLRAAAANGRDGVGSGGGGRVAGSCGSGGHGGTGCGSVLPPGLDVRNGEGVLLWVHRGGQLVVPGEQSVAAAAAAEFSPGVPTRRLHAFTSAYAALLPPGVEPVVFGWWAGFITTLSAGAQVLWQLLRGAAGTRPI